MKLFDHTVTSLEKAMDVRMNAQRVIAANIANVDTPGYIAQKVDFEASLKNALEGRSDDMVVNPSQALSKGLDGNNVSLESEISALSRNKMMYSVTTQIMGSKFRQLTSAIESQG